MPLNYPPFVVLSSHFRVTGGHDLNPTAQTLLGEDQQLFSAFNQLALQAMSSAGVGVDLLPVVVALASMAPGVSTVQRAQLATLFVRNALAVLSQAAPALAQVMLPAAAPGRKKSPAQAVGAAKRRPATKKKRGARRDGKK